MRCSARRASGAGHWRIRCVAGRCALTCFPTSTAASTSGWVANRRVSMSPKAGDLTGTVGLVTGGVSGIGAAITAELRGRGATVVAVDRNAHPKTAQSPGIAPDPVTRQVAGDVRDFATMSGISGKIRDEFGRLDFVVANAGITDWGSMSDGDPQRWRDVIDTNVLGVAQTIRAAMPILIAQGRGHIVITASISGRTAYVGEPIYI